MLKAVLFDVDGTLIDTEKVIITSLQQTLRAELERDVPAEQLTFILGIPGIEAIKPFTNDPNLQVHLLAEWARRNNAMTHENTLYPEVLELLNQLEQLPYQTGIITSKTDLEMAAEVARFGIEPYFDLIVTASDTTQHKPTPVPIYFAMEQLDLKATEILYIGDTPYDQQSAHAAGAEFAVAGWGAHPHTEFEQAEYQLTTPLDLLNHL